MVIDKRKAKSKDKYDIHWFSLRCEDVEACNAFHEFNLQRIN